MSNIDSTVPSVDKAWTIAFDDLEIGREIGSGGFGKVYRGEYLGAPVAIKRIQIAPDDPNRKDLEKFLHREIETIKLFSHPNVIQFVGVAEQEGILFLVTELVQGGDLQWYLKNKAVDLPWPLRFAVAHDVSLAMSYLHSKNIVHRDLKSSNLLIDNNWKVKVCDFGFARIVDDENNKSMTICGTDNWMAPEMITGQDYDERCDVFSFGVLLFELITRNKPTPNMRNQDFTLNTDVLMAQIPNDCPPPFLRLMLDCCEANATERPSFKHIAQTLKATKAALYATQAQPAYPPIRTMNNVSIQGFSAATGLIADAKKAMAGTPIETIAVVESDYQSAVEQFPNESESGSDSDDDEEEDDIEERAGEEDDDYDEDVEGDDDEEEDDEDIRTNVSVPSRAPSSALSLSSSASRASSGRMKKNVSFELSHGVDVVEHKVDDDDQLVSDEETTEDDEDLPFMLQKEGVKVQSDLNGIDTTDVTFIKAADLIVQQEPISVSVQEEEPVQEPVSEPITEPIQDPISEPVSEPVQEPVAEQIQEPVTEPIQEPVSEPIQEPVSEPIQEPVSEPIQEPVSEPVSEPIQEPVTEPISEPIQEPIQEPVSEPISEPVSEPVSEPIQEPVQEPIQEPIQEPVSVPISEPIQEPVSEPISEPVVQEPVSEPISEPVQEPIQEPVSLYQ
eukprot:gene19157-22948_t